MPFRYDQKVLFKYCDPAGIVFYPRYFEMINDCVEAFFALELHWPFEELLKSGGIPTASIKTDFKAASRHGDMLELHLNVQRLGRTSMDLEIFAQCDNELRFKAQSTLVHTNQQGRPTPWPNFTIDRIRKTMEDRHDT